MVQKPHRPATQKQHTNPMNLPVTLINKNTFPPTTYVIY